MKHTMLWPLLVLLVGSVMLASGLAGCGGTEAATAQGQPDTSFSQLTQGQKEELLQERLQDELDELFTIAFYREFEGFRGMLEQFFINDGNGEILGNLAVEAATGEMNSIVFSQDVTASGVPGMSLEELRSVAIDYLAGWGYILDDGYRLESEEFFPSINYGPGPEEKTYDYRVSWRRIVEGFEVADDACDMTIDPYSTRIISCHFPTMHGAEAEEIAEDADVISEEEAIEAAKRECPSPEDWMETTAGRHIGAETELEVSIEARKQLKTSGQQPPLTWVVEIMYEAYTPGTEHDGGNAIDHQGYYFEIDAASGEVVFKDMCQ